MGYPVGLDGFALNFVQVMWPLFEPDLKLGVTAGTPREADSNFEIGIDHDPAIEADNLTMPLTGVEAGHGFELVSQIADRAIDLPYWDDRVRMEARHAASRAPAPSHMVDGAGEGEVLVWRREARL
jgi:hypothetical protein